MATAGASAPTPKTADDNDDGPLYPEGGDGLPTDDEAQGKTPEIEIEIVDDVPPEDRQKPRPASERLDPDSDDFKNEVKGYSENVQARIGQMRYEFHEERRMREAAQRTSDAATNYAEGVARDNETLRKALETSTVALGKEFDARNDADLAAANQTFKEAFEAGDTDAIVTAQSEVSRIHAEKVAGLRKTHPAPAPTVAKEAAPDTSVTMPSVGVPDARAMGWIRDNTWFHKPDYEDMTGFAIGLHEKLVLREKLDPRIHEEYYTRIDEGLRTAFPEYKFASSGDQGRKGEDDTKPAATPKKSPAAPVAGPSRGGARTPRKVRLTPTQVSLAKRLGLTTEQYARQVAKEEAIQDG